MSSEQIHRERLMAIFTGLLIPDIPKRIKKYRSLLLIPEEGLQSEKEKVEWHNTIAKESDTDIDEGRTPIMMTRLKQRIDELNQEFQERGLLFGDNSISIKHYLLYNEIIGINSLTIHSQNNANKSFFNNEEGFYIKLPKEMPTKEEWANQYHAITSLSERKSLKPLKRPIEWIEILKLSRQKGTGDSMTDQDIFAQIFDSDVLNSKHRKTQNKNLISAKRNRGEKRLRELFPYWDGWA